MGLVMNLESLLSDRLAAALEDLIGTAVDPVVRRSQHADFQSGVALALKQVLKKPPRDIASEIVAGPTWPASPWPRSPGRASST
jgi:arginyl-tRNA synthetase